MIMIWPTIRALKKMNVNSAVPLIDRFIINSPTMAWDINAAIDPMRSASLPRYLRLSFSLFLRYIDNVLNPIKTTATNQINKMIKNPYPKSNEYPNIPGSM